VFSRGRASSIRRLLPPLQALAEVGGSVSARLVALDRLTSAIYQLRVGGEYVPCVDVERGHLWLSEDREQQEAAVHGCRSCPALNVCKGYVEAFPETAGTWGGKTIGKGALPEVLR
jgi:hypothetical protein